GPRPDPRRPTCWDRGPGQAGLGSRLSNEQPGRMVSAPVRPFCDGTGVELGSPHGTFDFVVAANRLPVDRVVDDDGVARWQTSPGGLVSAMDSVMAGRTAAWVGWAGDPGE